MLERWRTHELMLGPAALWDGSAEHESFAAWCSRHPGRRCRLWLAAPLLLELPVEPALPLTDDRALLAWAGGVVQHYHGAAASAWPLAAWQQGRVRGVSVLHGVALDALCETARAARVRLAGASPWWSLALRRGLALQPALARGPARLLVVEGARVVAIELERGRVQSLALRLLDAADPDALDAWCEALPARPTVALGYGLSAGRPARAEPAGALHHRWPPADWLTSPLAWR